VALTEGHILKFIDSARSRFDGGTTVAMVAAKTPIRTYPGWRHDPDFTHGQATAAFREAGLYPFWFLVEPKENSGADAIELLVLSKTDSLNEGQWASLRSDGQASAEA